MDEQNAILTRMFILLGLILLIPCILAFQLIRINYIEGENLRELWSRQAIELVPIPAERGKIYDANHTLLATNTVDYKIAFDPKAPGVTAETIQQLTMKLGQVTGDGTSFYRNKIQSAPSHSRYIVLGNNFPSAQKDEIEALNLKGVIIEENYRRKYTFSSLAAHVLGFVNYNMDGRTGLEAYYNSQLKGTDGMRQVRRDPFNRIYEYVGAPKSLPQNGHSLHTTINAYLQAILEDELKAGAERTNARYATGIIMDPKTGAILALANYPTFDPNFPGQAEENRRNFAIADMIEPGSTFKLVTAVAAVEQGVVDFDEIFETPENGSVVIHDLVLRDHDPLGDLTFQQVIQKSSNVAIAEIAMRLKPQVFYQYARNMGFGTATNIDLSGEESGRLSKPYEWSLVTLPWMSHGYEVQTTPLQILQAYAAFANNGNLMRPYIVEKIEDSRGKIMEEFKPKVIRKIANQSTIDKLLPVFESVMTDSGTGSYAQVEGLSIAGKTGTAKKVANGRYINKYRGSMVGFFPSRDPKYAMLILLDEPTSSIYGGVTAGPIFQNIATRIAGIDNEIQNELIAATRRQKTEFKMPSLVGLNKEQAREILSSLSLSADIKGKEGFVSSQIPEAGALLQPHEKITVTLAAFSSANEESETRHSVLIPDLTGMNMRQATTLLNTLGLDATIIGSGTIFTQFPKAGEKLQKGRAVTVRGRAKSMNLLTQATPL